MENITIICYPKCTTCQRAEKWLKEHGVKYTYRHIKEQNPTAEELSKWIKESELPIKRFFNTSGLLYKEYKMKEKVNVLPEKELIEILASDGMMVKRPLIIAKDKVLVGFKEAEWKAFFKK